MSTESSAGSRGKFRGIAAELRHRVETQIWRPGHRIPSEADLSHEFGVARMTIRTALRELEDAGLLQVIPGTGRVVADPTASASLSLEELASALRERIDIGEFPDGSVFLSEREVADGYSVTRHAARRALASMEATGLLLAVQGKGRIVNLR